jgi:hypothetical protein
MSGNSHAGADGTGVRPVSIPQIGPARPDIPYPRFSDNRVARMTENSGSAGSILLRR